MIMLATGTGKGWMATRATTPTSSRRRPGPTTPIRKGAVKDLRARAYARPGHFTRAQVEACMDPGLRRDDGVGEFMAETQKLIGISLEGSVG
jgi:hypothetical protein